MAPACFTSWKGGGGGGGGNIFFLLSLNYKSLTTFDYFDFNFLKKYKLIVESKKIIKVINLYHQFSFNNDS
jgi:hypothetical protein